MKDGQKENFPIWNAFIPGSGIGEIKNHAYR